MGTPTRRRKITFCPFCLQTAQKRKEKKEGDLEKALDFKWSALSTQSLAEGSKKKKEVGKSGIRDRSELTRFANRRADSQKETILSSMYLSDLSFYAMMLCESLISV